MTATSYCQACGADLGPPFRFCSQCGSRNSDQVSARSTKSVESEEERWSSLADSGQSDWQAGHRTARDSPFSVAGCLLIGVLAIVLLWFLGVSSDSTSGTAPRDTSVRGATTRTERNFSCDWEDEIRQSMRSGSDTRAYYCLKNYGLPECSNGRWRNHGFADEYSCADRVMEEGTRKCGHLCQ